MTSAAKDFQTAASPDKALWDAVSHRFGGSATKAAIAAGANVNAVDEKGHSVLMHAVRERRWEEMVPLLIAAGADVRYVAPDGETPYTACKDEEEDPREIRDGLNRLANKPALEKLLHAIGKKDVDEVQRILESGKIVDINLPIQSGDGWTAVGKCISEDAAVCLDLVLQAGADPNGTEDKRPLISAINEWHADPVMVRILLEAGADPDAADDEGLRPLPLAASKGHESIVTLLLDHGADVNINRGERDTAVHEAAEKGFPEIIRILAAHGADFTAVNQHGQPPLEVAVLNRHREAFDALMEAGADPLQKGNEGTTLIMDAAGAGEAGVMPLLLKHGIPIDATTNDGYTALGWAAWYGKGEAARALINLGASVDIANNEGKTALDVAREKGHIHVERMIEKKIADDVALGLRVEKPRKKPFRLMLEAKNAL